VRYPIDTTEQFALVHVCLRRAREMEHDFGLNARFGKVSQDERRFDGGQIFHRTIEHVVPDRLGDAISAPRGTIRETNLAPDRILATCPAHVANLRSDLVSFRQIKCGMARREWCDLAPGIEQSKRLVGNLVDPFCPLPMCHIAHPVAFETASETLEKSRRAAPFIAASLYQAGYAQAASKDPADRLAMNLSRT
jgi:hypothetical protein